MIKNGSEIELFNGMAHTGILQRPLPQHNATFVQDVNFVKAATPEYRNDVCHGPYSTSTNNVKVELEKVDLWNEFHQCTTEMVITKPGRRMFPTLQFRISGLEPDAIYGFYVVFVQTDNFRYKFQAGKWSMNGQAESPPIPISLCTYHHPDSPALGRLWMREPLSFHKIKLTNCTKMPMDMVLLNSMHKYQPLLVVVKLNECYSGQIVAQFAPPQTQFIVVTAYQNNAITKLKVKYNPFAKGFRQMDIDPREPDNHDSTIDETKIMHDKRKRLDSESSDTSIKLRSDQLENSQPLLAPFGNMFMRNAWIPPIPRNIFSQPYIPSSLPLSMPIPMSMFYQPTPMNGSMFSLPTRWTYPMVCNETQLNLR